jgi:hypothetical protein
MTTRTPFITVPLHQLKVGMTVVNQDDFFGTIHSLKKKNNDGYYIGDLGDNYPICVHFETDVAVEDIVDFVYYTAEGFEFRDSDCYEIEELHMGIKLVEEKKAVDRCANIEQPDISNNGLTTEELEAVNALVKTRGMTRAAAIMTILQ